MYAQAAAAKANGLMPTIELENRLTPVMAKMEYVGVAFDSQAWYNLVQEESRLADIAEQRVQDMLDLPHYTFSLFDGGKRGINLNNPKALKAALTRIGIGVPNTSADTLWEYWAKNAEAAPILQSVIEYRTHAKGPSFAYTAHINPVTGRIHTAYHQTGAKTGRVRSSNPNLQNVPTDSRYRACFIAQEGWVLVKSDAGQQEFRILGDMTGDEALIAVCLSDDVHTTNAQYMFSVEVPTFDQRRTAKNVGFALSYGAGALKIATMLRIPLTEAEQIVNYGRTRFPGVEPWANAQWQQAVNLGYVTTIGGRRRYFQVDPDEPHTIKNMARNTPIQGTAADIMKLALVLVDKELTNRNYQARLVLTVHDELVVEAPETESQDVAQLVVQKMEEAGSTYVKAVPIPADAVIDKVWRK